MIAYESSWTAFTAAWRLVRLSKLRSMPITGSENNELLLKVLFIHPQGTLFFIEDVWGSEPHS